MHRSRSLSSIEEEGPPSPAKNPPSDPTTPSAAPSIPNPLVESSIEDRTRDKSWLSSPIKEHSRSAKGDTDTAAIVGTATKGAQRSSNDEASPSLRTVSAVVVTIVAIKVYASRREANDGDCSKRQHSPSKSSRWARIIAAVVLFPLSCERGSISTRLVDTRLSSWRWLGALGEGTAASDG